MVEKHGGGLGKRALAEVQVQRKKEARKGE